MRARKDGRRSSEAGGNHRADVLPLAETIWGHEHGECEAVEDAGNGPEFIANKLRTWLGEIGGTGTLTFTRSNGCVHK